MSKTSKEMADEIRCSDSDYVTYGVSEIGTPIPRDDAADDIESMDDEMIGEGTWYECDKDGNVAE